MHHHMPSQQKEKKVGYTGSRQKSVAGNNIEHNQWWQMACGKDAVIKKKEKKKGTGDERERQRVRVNKLWPGGKQFCGFSSLQSPCCELGSPLWPSLMVQCFICEAAVGSKPPSPSLTKSWLWTCQDLVFKARRNSFAKMKGLNHHFWWPADRPAVHLKLTQRVFSISFSNTSHIGINLLGAEAQELQFSSQFKIAQRDISSLVLDSTRLGGWFACEDLSQPCICWWMLQVSKSL